MLKAEVLDFIEGDQTSWEANTLPIIAKKNQLAVYKHYGFWQCMDTLRDKKLLDDLWNSENPPWKKW